MIGKGVVFGLAFMLPLVAGLSAEANPTRAERSAFACDDEFQSVNGHEIATPYCEDKYIAKVARDHGDNVSASALRESTSAKKDACRLADSDIRVSEFCNENVDSD